MKAIPLTRRNHLWHIVDTLETLGIQSEPILAQEKALAWQYGDPDDLIPLRQVLSVIRNASRTSGDETFGLLAGATNSFDRFGTIGKLIGRSLSVYHALQTICRLANKQTSISKFWLAETDDTVWFCRGNLEGMDVGRRQMEQYTLMEMIRAVRLGADPNWKPAEIWLCAADTPRLEETEALSDMRIHYGQPFTAIAVPRSVLARPVRRDRELNPEIDELLEYRLRSSAPADDFVGSLRQAIAALLAGENLQIDCAAEVVGVHVRTFQRMLAQHGLTYKQLIDEVRFEAATDLLKKPGVTVTDIAFDVGYSDVAHFSRAFRRWAGVSPREYCRMNATN